MKYVLVRTGQLQSVENSTEQDGISFLLRKQVETFDVRPLFVVCFFLFFSFCVLVISQFTLHLVISLVYND